MSQPEGKKVTRNWPKVVIEVGGQPPSRRPYSYRPWFFINWFGGDESSRSQLSLFLPFFRLWVYP